MIFDKMGLDLVIKNVRLLKTFDEWIASERSDSHLTDF